MKSLIKTLILIITVFVISCSTYKTKDINEPCNKKNEKGIIIRKDKGDTYTLVDSTGLFVYYDNVYSSNFAFGTPLYWSTRKKVKAGFFSQTSCGRIYSLNYDNIKSLYKKTLPDFVKEVKETKGKLFLPVDSTSNVALINVLLKKYQK